MNREIRIKRLKFRAEHRGLREADFVVGSFASAYAERWSEDETAWFEAFLDEQDVDILAWALGTAEVPARLCGPMMDALRKLDYLDPSAPSR
jgi:antitoxin CptB